VTTHQRLTPRAWDALSEALATYWWYKRDLARFLRAEIGNQAPEVLSAVDLDGYKRATAGDLVSLLRANEPRYQDLALSLLARLAEVNPTFPNLARLDDAESKVEQAKAAHAEVVEVTKLLRDMLASNLQRRERLEDDRAQIDSAQPKELNDFRAKVESKAANVLGLCVAVNGFTDGAVAKHSTGSPLVLMNGEDLMAVLDGRIDLLDLLTRKRRHAAETGVPLLTASEILS
jgi:hypothetical protein